MTSPPVRQPARDPLGPRLASGESTVESIAPEPPRRRSHLWVYAIAVAVGLLIAGGAFSLGRWVFPTSTTPSKQALENQLFHTASVLLSEGHYAGAAHAYQQILALDPVNGYGYYDLGIVQQDEGEPTNAVASYEKALLIIPTYQPALFNLASLEAPTDPNAAIQLYGELQKLKNLSFPSDVAFNLGLLLAATGHPAEAARQLQSAVRLDPTLVSRVPAKYRPLLRG